MARDGKSVAVRVIWPTTGPKSGTTSNTFYARWTGAGVPVFSDVANLMNDVWKFLNGASGGAGTITFYLGPQIYRATNSVLMDAYSMDLASTTNIFGAPIYTLQKTPGASAATTPLPNEVAMTLSYRAAYGSDPEHSGTTRPRASDRGRVYLGPLHTGVMGSVTAPNGTITVNVQAAVITAILAAYSTLVSDAVGHSWALSVHSRKERVLKDVASKAMDNSLDTQRRREVEPPSIQTWVAV